MKNYSTQKLSAKSRKELRDYVFNYYRDHIQRSVIVNKQTGITIHFTKDGRVKTSSLYASVEKSIVIINLPELLTAATRIKTTEIKRGSSLAKNFPEALYMMNFLIKCKIDGQVKKFICGVVLLKTGKFQYSLYHNEVRGKK